MPREKWLHYLQTVETLIRRRVWPGSALFAKYPFRGLQTTMGWSVARLKEIYEFFLKQYEINMR